MILRQKYNKKLIPPNIWRIFSSFSVCNQVKERRRYRGQVLTSRSHLFSFFRVTLSHTALLNRAAAPEYTSMMWSLISVISFIRITSLTHGKTSVSTRSATCSFMNRCGSFSSFSTCACNSRQSPRCTSCWWFCPP